ncbi:MAG TPA: hypothetical protein VGE21_03270 [Flavobacteriales bacterium]
MTKEMEKCIETRQARVERISEELLEVRFKPDLLVDGKGVGEAILAKRKLAAGAPHDVLMVLPQGAELDTRMVNMDPELHLGPCQASRRLAFVVPDEVNAQLVGMHFRYHPRAFATEVFSAEEDARQWLAAQAMQAPLS